MRGRLVCDLSNNNGQVNFDELKKYGVFAVCLKATQGVEFTDPTFHDRAKRAKKAGLVVLSYHFAGFNDPVEEANHYANVIHPARLNGRPMLDVEIPSGTINVEVWCRDFNRHLRYRRGLPLPLYYGDPAYITEHHYKHPIGAGLVLASYGRDDGKDYPYVVPHPWKEITAHQFTSKGHLPGVVGEVDVWHTTKPYKLKLSRLLEWWEK
jgi:lysozyme